MVLYPIKHSCSFFKHYQNLRTFLVVREDLLGVLPIASRLVVKQSKACNSYLKHGEKRELSKKVNQELVFRSVKH